jgi:hypothetical protein
MTTDLSVGPWDRLAKLSPPGTSMADLQTAADRYGLTADLYAAAADLWEEAAMAIDLTASTDDNNSATKIVGSVSQDGIAVTYVTDALAGGGLTGRIAQHAQYQANARRMRARAKTKTVKVHNPEYDPWLNTDQNDPCDVVIVVDGV